MARGTHVGQHRARWHWRVVRWLWLSLVDRAGPRHALRNDGKVA